LLKCHVFIGQLPGQLYQSSVKERKGTPFEPSFEVFLRRKRLISFVYIAARVASICIEQFAIPEQVVFNLLLYHYAGIILSIIVGAKPEK